MAVDPWIARGLPPIDISNTLAQIAMLRQRDQALAADEARTKVYDRRLDQVDQERTQASTDKAQEKADAQEALTVYQAAKAGNPQAKSYALKKISEGAPGLFDGMTPDQAWTQIEPIMRQQLGIPEGPGAIKLQDLGGGVRAVTQGGEMKGGPNWPDKPQQYAPDFATETQDLPDGYKQNYTIDRRTGRKSDFKEKYKPTSSAAEKDRLVTTQLGETYKYDEATGTMKLVPIEGEAAAPAVAPPKGQQPRGSNPELSKLPNGTVITQNGKKFRVMNGQVVPYTATR